ncbi:MAG: hypothetical protein K6E85_16310 [Lachnospiraceae bacterium]|nr:hypothetical protein [Lachnospiraceae bacterium]
MKSKTSFFNKTIFFKNIRRYWLLPAIYLFCYIWAMPVTIYFGNRSRYDYISGIERLNSLKQSIMGGYLIVSLVFAIGAGLLTAQCIYSYLQRSASVNFFHSLPSDRKQMFFTNLLSGFAMIAAPVVITGFISMLVGLSIELNVIAELFAWMLVSLIMAAFFYMFAVICTLMSGQNWFGGGIYIIFLIYYIGMMILCVAIISLVNIGCDIDYWLPEGALGIVSPITFFGRSLLTDNDPIVNGIGSVLSKMSLELIEGSIFTVLFVIAAYFLYKYRHSETAGDTVAFRFAKPIFRWGFALSFSLLLTVIMLATIRADHKVSKVVMIVFMIIFGSLGFIIAQMLIKKSVHVFKLAKAQEETKKTSFGFKQETICFCVIIAAIGAIVLASAAKVNKYVPDKDDVRTVMLNTNYGIWTQNIYDRNIISEVTDIHREIIDELDLIATEDSSTYTYVTDKYTDVNRNPVTEYLYFDIDYTLGSGRTVTRHYNIPNTAKAYKHIEDMYSKKEFMVSLAFGEVDSSKIGAAYLIDTFSGESIACYYNDASALYDALLDDVNEGVMKAGDLYSDRYVYEIMEKGDVFEIKKKSGEFFDENGNMVNNESAYSIEIPYEYVGMDLDSQDNDYIIAFSPRDMMGGLYYCVRLNKKCTNMLNIFKNCRWFM